MYLTGKQRALSIERGASLTFRGREHRIVASSRGVAFLVEDGTGLRTRVRTSDLMEGATVKLKQEDGKSVAVTLPDGVSAATRGAVLDKTAIDRIMEAISDAARTSLREAGLDEVESLRRVALILDATQAVLNG